MGQTDGEDVRGKTYLMQNLTPVRSSSPINPQSSQALNLSAQSETMKDYLDLMSEQGLREAGPCDEEDGEWCCHVVRKRMEKKDNFNNKHNNKANKI